MPKYVVVGGSAGTVGAIEAIREVDTAGTIAVVSWEPFPTYSRPMLGEYLSGEASLGKITYRTHEFWRMNRCEAYTERRAEGIDLVEKSVKLDKDEDIHFDKLLIATGSKPLVTKIDGANKTGVYTFSTLADAEGLKVRIGQAGRAVIIGGGLIGLCVAEALFKQGVKVTIVELQSSILGRLLDSVASDIIRAAMQEKGISVVTGCAVRRITGKEDDENKVGTVILEDGKAIPCDIVVVAVGVVPNVDLVLGTDVRINKGILVDRFMRSSVPYVYACGDVVEAYDFISGQNCILPQWYTAYMGGRIAGYNMAGVKTLYPGGTVMSALKYFDIPIIAAGITCPSSSEGYQVLVSREPQNVSYRKIVMKHGKIKGFILVNDIEKAGIYFHLMSKDINVNDFRERLCSESFGLIKLPEQLRNTMLMESQQTGQRPQRH